MKNRISNYIKVFISIGLLAGLFYVMRGQYTTIFAELKKTNLALFAVALAIYAVNIALVTLRLKVLVKAEGIKMPFFRLLELNFIGFFFNNFMPSAIGGDIIKAYYTGNITGKKANSYMAVFMDRLTGLFSFAGMGLLALIIGWNAVTQVAVRRSVLVFVIFSAFIAFVVLNKAAADIITKILIRIRFKNIGEKLHKIYEMLHSYRSRRWVLAHTIALSIVSQASYFFVIQFLFNSLNQPLSIKVVFLIMPIICVVTLLPSLGGLGLREGAIVALFGPIVGREKSFGVSIILLALLFIISLIGGIIYLTSPQFRSVKIREEEGEFI
ncbi:MAG: lysylphosphatidylglycerol synthase transmembrane domain-containing protein [Candidatus Omnitrophica bacterium]|nr:lysylphosphatidylglycerol synthase transmembrane domain-containing protein [Candidatus Omnitrophota bacterium]